MAAESTRTHYDVPTESSMNSLGGRALVLIGILITVYFGEIGYRAATGWEFFEAPDHRGIYQYQIYDNSIYFSKVFPLLPDERDLPPVTSISDSMLKMVGIEK